MPRRPGQRKSTPSFMGRVTVYLGGPLDGTVAIGHPPTVTEGCRFAVVNPFCPVWVEGLLTYRHHVYQVVGKRVGQGGELQVLAEHIGQVAAADATFPSHRSR